MTICGDGITGSGEEYDDGNLINNDGVSSGCKYEDPNLFCAIFASPNNQPLPFMSVATWNLPSWITATSLQV